MVNINPKKSNSSAKTSKKPKKYKRYGEKVHIF